MGIEENKEIIRKIYDGLNDGDFDVLDQHFADDFKAHSIGGVVLDKAAYKQFIRNVSTSVCPDLQSDLEYMVAEGDRVWFSWVWAGTDKGGFGGNPPTCRRLSVKESVLCRFENGKITEYRQYADRLSMWQQLGIDPPKS